jgi:hypothetical protein
MGISYPKEYFEDLSDTVNAFTESDENIRSLHSEGRKIRGA